MVTKKPEKVPIISSTTIISNENVEKENKLAKLLSYVLLLLLGSFMHYSCLSKIKHVQQHLCTQFVQVSERGKERYLERER